MKHDVYRQFVKEAYIEPIRSVLIIDDDYPTLDEILTLPRPEKLWHSAKDQVEKVIAQFRADHQPMMVDIHDGENVDLSKDTVAVKYLHQSDLLVLDYELDRSRPHDGSKAIGIARSVLANRHFNLIVIHTREDLPTVFSDVLISLLSPDRAFLSVTERTVALELLGRIEADHENILAEIKSSAGLAQFFGLMAKHGVEAMSSYLLGPEFAQFDAIFERVGLESPEERRLLKLLAVSEYQSSIANQMSRISIPQLSWSQGDTSWIRCDSGFIAFASKTTGSDIGLIDRLLDALCAWKPAPSRLILAKLRSEIASRGVVAESAALGTKHVHASWYKRFLEGQDLQRDYLISEAISRHSEQLLGSITPDVSRFAARLVGAEEAEKESAVLCLEHFEIDLRLEEDLKRARFEHNSFVCSKPVEGFHLTPGHVFQSDEWFWVCLTPACDLVPGQKRTGRFEGLGDNLPVTAVRLQSVSLPTNPTRKQREAYDKGTSSGRFIVLNVGGELKTFSLNAPDDEGSAPHWFTLFVADQGKFSPTERVISLFGHRTTDELGLSLHPFQATIVAQLRYEYALNLMQKLGVSMSRIGLDFQ